MPVETVNSMIIAFGFIAVWMMVGQFSFSRR